MEQQLVLFDCLLHFFILLDLVSFLASLPIDIRLVFFYKTFLHSNDLIFLPNDAIESFFVSAKSLNHFVFIAARELSLQLISLHFFQLFL